MCEVKHEEKFRSFVAERKNVSGSRGRCISKGSVDSYVRYLEAVSWGFGAPISPELLHSCKDGDILAKARKKPLRGKPGEIPAEKYVKNWASALNRYREMCDKYGLFPRA